jgi:Tfp pilus assembly major pilin PilA
MRTLNLGVTLLEVMLLLAIAAMIIVMSVRYYETATANQQAVAALNVIQGVTALADGLAQGANSYTIVTTEAVRQLMPAQSMLLPWGAELSITSQNAQNYDVSLPDTPAVVCQLLKARMASNIRFANLGSNTCIAPANFTYTYDAAAA